MSDIAFSVIVNNNGIDDIVFKTIMLKGDKGNSIDHISKTGTSGKVDTYTIYLTDGTVGGTFTVTNGQDGAPVNIDDTVTALDKTWSSSKLSGMIKSIDDSTVDADKLWSSQKINSMLAQTGTIQNQAIASFSDGADDVPVSSLIVDIDAVQAGSGTPSPTNVRAISGWSSCDVVRNGFNQWDEEWEVGSFNQITGEKTNSTVSIRSKNLIHILPSTSYYYKSQTTDIRLYYYDATGNYINTETVNNAIKTSPAKAHYVCFNCGNDANPTTSYDRNVNPICINLSDGNRNGEYEAYNGGTDTISLGQTVYGGTLNVSTGLLTIDKQITDLGDFNWVYDSQYDRFNTTISNIKNSRDPRTTSLLCSCFQVISDGRSVGNVPDLSIYQGTNKDISAKNLSYTDATLFKTSVTGQKVVYPLATPTTVQLTPTEVRTLLGNNNIFADTGDVNELVYFKTGSEAVARLIEAYMRGE